MVYVSIVFDACLGLIKPLSFIAEGLLNLKKFHHSATVMHSKQSSTNCIIPLRLSKKFLANKKPHRGKPHL
jgi:hypothetical protein